MMKIFKKLWSAMTTGWGKSMVIKRPVVWIESKAKSFHDWLNQTWFGQTWEEFATNPHWAVEILHGLVILVPQLVWFLLIRPVWWMIKNIISSRPFAVLMAIYLVLRVYTSIGDAIEAHRLRVETFSEPASRTTEIFICPTPEPGATVDCQQWLSDQLTRQEGSSE